MTNFPNPTTAGLACNLAALTAAERERHAVVLGRLQALTEAIEELPEGYALRLPDSDEAWLLAAEFVTRERRCCPFFTFTLTAAANGGGLRLGLTGGEGVKAFIQQELLGA